MRKKPGYNLIRTGTEKTKNEIVYNNIQDYMQKTHYPLHEQAEVFKNYSLYKTEEDKRDAKQTKILKFSTLAVVAGVIGKFIFNIPYLEWLIFTVTTGLLGITGACLCKENPYDNCNIKPDLWRKISEIEQAARKVKVRRRKKRLKYAI